MVLEGQMPFGKLTEVYGNNLFYGNRVLLLKHQQNSGDKLLLRMIGLDEKRRVEFDTFRIQPEYECLRFGFTSSRKALTIKQFIKRFQAYDAEYVESGKDEKEWDSFLDTAYHIYLYQKLL